MVAIDFVHELPNIRDRPISPGSSWQNGIAERLIGTLRRECLDQMLIFGEAHLRRILSAYASYYNQARTHLALQKDAPLHRAVQRSGVIATIPILAGLHHQYVRILFSERTTFWNEPLGRRLRKSNTQWAGPDKQCRWIIDEANASQNKNAEPNGFQTLGKVNIAHSTLPTGTDTQLTKRLELRRRCSAMRRESMSSAIY